MEVIHDLLGVEGFKIYQDDSLNMFSVDSNILASFVSLKKTTKKVLDLGTGNAPIALYLTLRTNAEIYGVELQDAIFELAKKSVKINKREEQIKLYKANIKEIDKIFDLHSFDTVVFNPPFFKILESSHINPNLSLAISRHEIEATLEDFIKMSSLMVKNKGNVALVHRTERLSDIILLMRKYKIEPKRIRFVYPDEYSDSNQVLVEGIYNGKSDGLKILKPLYTHAKYEYNQSEIKDIYNGNVKE